MNALHYTILAYAIVSALLWGYGATLFLAARAQTRRELRDGGRQ